LEGRPEKSAPPFFVAFQILRRRWLERKDGRFETSRNASSQKLNYIRFNPHADNVSQTAIRLIRLHYPRLSADVSPSGPIIRRER
jgi:hypothetical protein